jgi:hypothetical protein
LRPAEYKAATPFARRGTAPILPPGSTKKRLGIAKVTDPSSDHPKDTLKEQGGFTILTYTLGAGAD